jgi:DNA-binding transcriptional LysR family regulator
MTFDQLLVFHAITKKGSFRAASEHLHRSQPAVSIAIKNLEEELGFLLFSREKYKPSLTEKGTAFLNKSKSVVAHMNELLTFGKQLSLTEELEIRIVIDGICSIDPIMKTLKSFMQEYPCTKIRLEIETLHGVLEKLLHDDADLVITSLPSWEERVDFIPLMDTHLVPVASPKFPLLDLDDTILEEDLIRYPQIVVKDTSQNLPKKTAGILQGAETWTVNEFSIKKEIILSGLGWGKMPLHMVEKEIKKGTLIHLDLPFFPSTFGKLYLARKKNNPLGPIATALWEELQSITIKK